MSQIDKVNYIPVLFWFVVLFIAFYALLYTFTLPLLYSAKQMREKVYKSSGESLVHLKANDFFLKAMAQAKKLNKNFTTALV
jgi:hypothetical protein